MDVMEHLSVSPHWVSLRGNAKTRRTRRRGILLRALIATVVVLAAPNDAASQFAVHGDHAFLVDQEDPGVLHLTDMASGRRRELYRTESGRIFDFKVSPTGSMIAVTAQLLENGVDPQAATAKVHNRMMFEKTTLHIIGVAGNEIDAIDDVRQFSWSPDGRQLAYVTGDYRGGYEDYGNSRTWIWDLADKSKKEISRRGYYVNWVAFDSRIYLWEKTAGVAGKVYAYDPVAGALVETPHKSIYFSRTGDYYYHPGGGIGLRENVYVRSGDLSLKDASRVLAAFCGMRPIAWAPHDDLLLLEVCRKVPGAAENAMLVYDPASDMTIEVGSGESFAWGNDSSELIVKNGSRIDKRPLVKPAQ